VAEPSPHVLVLSDDPLLRELVAELLSRERFRVSEAGSLEGARAIALRDPAAVVLLDAMLDGELAGAVLSAPEPLFGEAQAALVVIGGSGTPASVREHPLVDRVLPQPLTSEVLVGVLRHHAVWHSSRQLQSGTRPRPDVETLMAATSTTKKSSK
jgi:DNA-binding NtrC family response regulator